MGMFDYVIPECVLPDEGAKRVKEWQTKDLQEWPFVDKYRITAEGRLMEEVYHTEDCSDKSAPPGSLASVMGIWTKIHEGWRDLNYHGVLNFYGVVDEKYDADHWYEYSAKFTDGSLVRIERVTERYGLSPATPATAAVKTSSSEIG